MNRGTWPYFGAYHLICAVVGWFIGNLPGAVLGLFLGPIGLLIWVLVGHK